ncbi:MAG: hypothetical protein Ct9H90mP22_3010 [Gammaproteobacteria bacterium]|nr:MAG: hypothetical protein Ct9H90mP22_3010 [Gammaproteobacteria bacterium]
MFRHLSGFFNLPDNVKESFIVPDIGGARGFTKFKTETAKNYDRPDLKEFWHVGRDNLTNPKNIWIDELKNHKNFLWIYTINLIF